MVRLAEQQVVLNAPIERVDQHLTTVEGLLRWMAVEAVVEPVAGGRLQWTHENGATMIGRFIELDPPRRVVFAYGWKDDLMGVAPESTTVEIDLMETGGNTTASLGHRSIPEDVIADHERGWLFFLSRLQGALNN
jgi:uncharacterized protein YndB with AHSA1/START domain